MINDIIQNSGILNWFCIKRCGEYSPSQYTGCVNVSFLQTVLLLHKELILYKMSNLTVQLNSLEAEPMLNSGNYFSHIKLHGSICDGNSKVII